MAGESRPIAVLHVDDDGAFLDLAATFLERVDEELSVHTATSASAGRAVLEDSETAVDCVISDHEMPGETGIEFLAGVRDTHPDLPFILFTGKGSEEVANDAISAGVTDYMQKDGGTDQFTVLANRVRNAVEQSRAQREATRTRKRLTELTESSDDCLWMFDADWADLLFVSGYEDVWGRPEAAIRDDPQDFLTVAHPEDRAQVEQAMERLSAGESIDLEYRIRRNDADAWVWVKGQPVFDDEGSVVRVVGFTRDVTDRREERRRQETLIDNLPGIAYRCPNEPDWPMEFIRGDCESLTGYSASDLESGTVSWGSNVTHPADRDDNWEAIQAAIEADRPFELTYRITTRGGETRWVWERGRAVDREDEVALEGFITDVTERVEYEQTLEETTSRLEALFDQSPDMINVHDEAGRILEPNPRLCAETGYSADELTDMRVWELDASITESEARTAWEAMDRGERRRLDGTYERADGSTFPVEVHLRRVELNDADRFVVISRNVTERVERERALEAQNERLDEFASIVSHDLRNPLNVAAARLELAREDGDSDHLASVERAHDRMDALIEDLLTMSRDGKPVETTRPVDLATVVKSCWEHVETGESTLSVDAEATIEADPGRLQRLFENLIRNAVEHSSAPVRVTVGDTAEGFYVADDGPGVPEEDREQVFESGYSTTLDGIGFGLTIVDRVATAHGWAVELTESADGGARFDVRGVDFADAPEEPTA